MPLSIVAFGWWQIDILDKGVAQVIKEFISPSQAQDPSVVEKASDAVRSGFKQVSVDCSSRRVEGFLLMPHRFV